MKNHLATTLLAALIASSPAHANGFDWSEYDRLLAHYVVAGEKNRLPVNLVNYTLIKADPAFATLVQKVKAYPRERLEKRSDRMAFYINAYNILTIQVILDHWPLDSIKDIGGWFSGPWDLPVLPGDGDELTLDDIEHRILRPMGEPGVHFALNCASVSCPNLRLEAYRGDRLDRQLRDQARGFLHQEGKGTLLEGDELRLSKIFDWYEDDFEDGIDDYVRDLRPNLEFRRVATNLPYDWAVNGR